jgi:regulatory protein
LTEFDQIRERALFFLARREFSVNELKQRLLEKTQDLLLVEQVLQELIENNLQSDRRFAESYIRRRMAKGFGPLHIEHELQKHRLDGELVKENLAACRSQWSQTLKILFKKKFGGSSLATDLKVRTKQVRFLQSRGFNLFQINQYLIESVDE